MSLINEDMPNGEMSELVANIAPKTKKSEDPPVYLAAVDSANCFFSGEKVEVSVKRFFTEEYHPVSAIADGKCVEFIISQLNLSYLCLNKSVLRVKLKILTADGTQVKASDHVAFAQSPLNSVWRNCDLLIQQQPMSTGIGYNIAYKNIIDKLVYTPEAHLESVAQTELFYKDTAGHLNDLDFTPAGVNKGLLHRYEFSKDGEEVWCEGPLAHDFFTIPAYLPSGVNIILRLWPHQSGDFPLLNAMTTDTYKFKITECTLVMQGVEPTSGTLTAHNKILADSPALFFYSRSNIRTFTVPQNVSTWAVHQLFTDEIPFDMVVGLVDSESYLGSDKKNPFLFGTHNVNFISFAAEGYQAQSYHVNYDRGQYAAAYRALYQADVGSISPGGVVKYKEFPKGYTLYRFSLSPMTHEQSNRLRNGNTRLTVNFSKPTTASLMAICYGKFHDYFTMDMARNIRLVPFDKLLYCEGGKSKLTLLLLIL